MLRLAAGIILAAVAASEAGGRGFAFAAATAWWAGSTALWIRDLAALEASSLPRIEYVGGPLDGQFAEPDHALIAFVWSESTKGRDDVTGFRTAPHDDPSGFYEFDVAAGRAEWREE